MSVRRTSILRLSGQRMAIIVCLLLMMACAGESADDLFSKGERATHDVHTFDEAIRYLTAFLAGYGDDPRADVAMQALARVYQAQGKSEIAIKTYQDLITKFPKSRYADQAQFMIGYIHDFAGDKASAIKAYEAVITRFPGSGLADDAKISIANINKPLEAWIASEESTQ